MQNIIVNYLEDCVGCNRCVRVCPVDEANCVRLQGDKSIKIEIDNSKCIVCGACLLACNHGARHYKDDTKRFFSDLNSGVSISMFAAPAVKSNFDEWGRLFTWLRSLGVQKIYDVSLGADICTWAHIRYIQKHGAKPIISQPCPAIVNYILMYRNELLKYLSPVHSPMLCTAIYMRKYEKIDSKIAGLSPCAAKTHEFEATNFVDYNVTFKKLLKYIKKNNIALPMKSTEFDSYEAGLGSLYSMPGGLKENVEHYVGKSLRVDKSEGQKVVYNALDEYAKYAKRHEAKLPVLFDVLNCSEGCNFGTGCVNEKDIFEVNAKMDALRQAAIKENNLHYMDDLFKKFDETLRLEDFIRTYAPKPVHLMPISQEKMNNAFLALGKTNETSKKYNCGACGSDTCYEMARKIAKGLNVPENCTEKTHEDVKKECKKAETISAGNLESFETIFKEIADIKEMMQGMVSNVDDITAAISSYDNMVTDIERISEKVSIISLNASIEATKAGQHGKAFDVVAKEIRNLAQNSADSAMKTKKAAEKANNAIKAVNETVVEVNKHVTRSYDNILVASDKTKKIIGGDA